VTVHDLLLSSIYR